MTRAIQSPFALVVVSSSALLLTLVLIESHHELFEPGGAALFAIGLVGLTIARR